MSVHVNNLSTEYRPTIIENPNQTTNENMDLGRLKSVWQGDEASSYATTAIIDTLAIALKLMEKPKPIIFDLEIKPKS
jgi:hypothetical protein